MLFYARLKLLNVRLIFKINDEIHYVMHYLFLKGHSARSAMNEIHIVYDTDYPSYSTAKKMFDEFRDPEKILSQSEKQNSPKKMKRIDEIQSVLDENPNASVRLIA